MVWQAQQKVYTVSVADQRDDEPLRGHLQPGNAAAYTRTMSRPIGALTSSGSWLCAAYPWQWLPHCRLQLLK